METPSQLITELLRQDYRSPTEVQSALVNAIAMRDQKISEESYRKGVRDAEGLSDISPLLLTSQVAAYQIINTRNAQFSIEQENGGLTITKTSDRLSDAICITAVNYNVIKII